MHACRDLLGMRVDGSGIALQVGGIITPPLLVGAAANDVRTQQFLISSSLIVSGICTVIHCIQLKIPFTGGRLYYGTGATFKDDRVAGRCLRCRPGLIEHRVPAMMCTAAL